MKKLTDREKHLISYFFQHTKDVYEVERKLEKVFLDSELYISEPSKYIDQFVELLGMPEPYEELFYRLFDLYRAGNMSLNELLDEINKEIEIFFKEEENPDQLKVK